MNVPRVTLNNGTEIPSVGLGCWKIPKDVVGNLVYEAIKSGVRHLDCACDYGNEVEVGHGVKKAIDEGIVTRADLWVSIFFVIYLHHLDVIQSALFHIT